MPRGKVFDELEEELLRGGDAFVEELEKYVEKKRERDEKLTLDDLVYWMKATVSRGDIFSMLVQGLSGHGKTTLALLLASRYYRRGSRPGWRRALTFTMFDPVEIVALIFRYNRRGRMVPLIVFDDAGAWLSKWGLTVDKRFFLEFTNLLRTAVGSIIYTDIYSISKYVRDTVKVRVIVQKIPRQLYVKYGIPARDRREWSVARLYVTKVSISGPYYKRLADVVYPLDLPRRVRAWYRRKRNEYTGKLAARVLYRLLTSRAGQRVLRTSGGRKLLNELYEMLIEEYGIEEE